MIAKMSRREAIALLGYGAIASQAFGKTPSMLTRPIHSSKERLPVIGLGTWQTFDVAAAESARKPLGDVLSLFVELGGRVVDSSPMYGRSETTLGDLAVKLGLRDKLFIATKVWTSGRSDGE